MQRLFFACLLMIAAGLPVRATDVCGSVCNSTWNLAGSPWVVTCDVEVAAGCFLDIEAGASVRFQSGTGLIVDGALDIAGASGNLVTLTSDEATPSRGDWDSIRIESGGNATIAFAEIAWATNGVFSSDSTIAIADTTIRESSQRGIRATGGMLDLDRTALSDNQSSGLRAEGGVSYSIDTVSATDNGTYGVYVLGASSGTIDALTASGQTYGLYVYRGTGSATTANVTGSTFMGNTYGVYVQGQNNAAFPNPQLTVSASTLMGNSTYDLYATGYYQAESVTLDLDGNWWGTTDAMLIAENVYDRKNNANAPAVDWCSYLDGPPSTGSLAHGSTCPELTICSADAAWNTTAQPYLLTSALSVCAGRTLDIGPGVDVDVATDGGMRIGGTLNVLGTTVDPVTLGSQAGAPARGDWDGLTFLTGSNGTISESEIAWATYGIEATGSTIDVDATTIRQSSQRAIWMKGGTLDLDDGELRDNQSYGLFATDAADFDLTNVTIADNGTYGVYAEDASTGLVADVVSSGHTYGLYAYRSTGSATTVDVTGSTFTTNTYGIYLQGQNNAAFFDPVVTVTGSSLFDNSSYDLYAQSFYQPESATVSAEGNWWGTTDAAVIAANIYDRKNTASAPAVAWCSYIDAPPPTGVLAHTLTCPDTQTCDETESWNDTSTPYLLTTVKTVCPTGTLEIGPGVEVRGATGSAIDVEGTIDINGLTGNVASLTSVKSVPGRGDWRGLRLFDGSNATIDGAEILWSTYGVEATNATLTLVDTSIRESSQRGIWLKGGSLDGTDLSLDDNQSYGLYVTDQANVILDTATTSNNGTYGAYFEDASTATIDGLTSSGNTYGIYAYRSIGAATDLDITGATLTANTYGLYLQGQNNPTFFDPVVDITASSLFGNSNTDVYATAYTDPFETTISMGGNWWGTTDASEIGSNVFDRKNSSSSPAVDWCSYLDGPPGTGVLAHSKICPSLSLCSGSENWNVTSDPYLLVSRVNVCAGQTLDIGAGVETRAVGLGGIRVAGTLNINGASGQPALLTTDDATPENGDWGGLEIVSGAIADIDHAELAWANYAIESTLADVSVDDTLFRDAQQRGIWFKGGDLSVGDSQFHDNASYAIFLTDQSTFTLDAIDVTESSTGVYVEDGSTGTIRDLDASDCIYGIYAYRSNVTPTVVDVAQSTLRGNTYGIYAQGQNTATLFNPIVTVTTSLLDGNSSHGLYATSFRDAAASFVYAPDNWWGSEDEELIAEEIFDYEDSVNSPRVQRQPFGSGCDPAIGRNSDSDAFGDLEDNCPALTNLDQADGDSDGMGDLCDPDPASVPVADCNGIDDVSDGYVDSDGDGWGDLCDFHPMRADSYPGAPEICDGRDNDGDQLFAAGELTDLDLDGAVDCLDGMGDCDDMNANVYPCNCERCNNLIDDDCSGAADGLDASCPLNDYCVIITPGTLELIVDRGACVGGNAATATDLIRGSTSNLGLAGGSIDLGNVACVSAGLTLDRSSDMAEDGNPLCNEGSVFWLARPAGFGDFGTSSDGSPRDVSNPSPACP